MEAAKQNAKASKIPGVTTLKASIAEKKKQWGERLPKADESDGSGKGASASSNSGTSENARGKLTLAPKTHRGYSKATFELSHTNVKERSAIEEQKQPIANDRVPEEDCPPEDGAQSSSSDEMAPATFDSGGRSGNDGQESKKRRISSREGSQEISNGRDENEQQVVPASSSAAEVVTKRGRGKRGPDKKPRAKYKKRSVQKIPGEQQVSASAAAPKRVSVAKSETDALAVSDKKEQARLDRNAKQRQKRQNETPEEKKDRLAKAKQRRLKRKQAKAGASSSVMALEDKAISISSGEEEEEDEDDDDKELTFVADHNGRIHLRSDQLIDPSEGRIYFRSAESGTQESEQNRQQDAQPEIRQRFEESDDSFKSCASACSSPTLEVKVEHDSSTLSHYKKGVGWQAISDDDIDDTECAGKHINSSGSSSNGFDAEAHAEALNKRCRKKLDADPYRMLNLK